MDALRLYLRREPTTDPLLLSRMQYLTGPAKLDVVAYRDPGCQVRVARWPWDYKRPDRRTRRVYLNCYLWRVQWLPDMGTAS